MLRSTKTLSRFPVRRKCLTFSVLNSGVTCSVPVTSSCSLYPGRWKDSLRNLFTLLTIGICLDKLTVTPLSGMFRYWTKYNSQYLGFYSSLCTCFRYLSCVLDFHPSLGGFYYIVVQISSSLTLPSNTVNLTTFSIIYTS